MTNYTKKNSEGNVQKRQQGIIWVEVNMTNPNGNGNDGRPRQLPDGRGTIHPVCFKAKIRTSIQDQESLAFVHLMAKSGISEKDFDRYRIMECKNRGFGHDIDASTAVKKLLALSDEKIQAHYWDHRIFGSTLLENNEDKSTKGEVRRITRTGCVTMTHLVSVAPIHIVDDQIVKRFPFGKKHVEGETGTFGSTSVVQHGLYVGMYTYNPLFAEGVTEEDLNLFKTLIVDSFGLSQSANRSAASVIKVLHVTHSDCIGNEREFSQFYNAMIPRLKAGITVPSSLEDYDFVKPDFAKAFSKAEVISLA
jgi:Cas7 group CRISPR-associated protein Csh2